MAWIRNKYGGWFEIPDDEYQKNKQISVNEEQADIRNRTVDSNQGNQTPEQFNKSISEAKNSRPVEDKWRVDVHTPEEYREKGCKCWKSEDGSTVAVTKEGDIISVCKHFEGTKTKGWQLLQQGVKMGGTKLDSFAGNHKFYTENGFEPVSWCKFDEKYAPEGWKESKCPKEPVIFYKYVGKGNVKYLGWKGRKEFLTSTKPFRGPNAYDDAYNYRDSQIKK